MINTLFICMEPEFYQWSITIAYNQIIKNVCGQMATLFVTPRHGVQFLDLWI